MLGAVLIAAVVAVPVAILVSRGGTTTTVTPPASTPTPNPSQRAAASAASALYAQSMKIADQSAGFSYSVTSSGGGGALTVTGVSGQADGTQVFNETTEYGDEQFSLVLAPNQTVYFQGNAAAVEDQLGVSAADAPGLSGQWVSAVIGDGPYKDMELGITVGSQLSEVTLVATSTQQVTGSGGAPLTRILGNVPATTTSPAGTGHLDISPGSHLPVSYAVSYGESAGTQTETFTGWGTAPSVTVPAAAVAWSTLTTSAPPDGYGSGVTPSAAPTPTPSPEGSA